MPIGARELEQPEPDRLARLVQLGLEYLYWRTKYKDIGEGVANRSDLHLSVMF